MIDINKLNIELAKVDPSKVKEIIITIGGQIYNKKNFRRVLNLRDEIIKEIESGQSVNTNLISSLETITKFFTVYMANLYEQLDTKDLKRVLSIKEVQEKDFYQKCKIFYDQKSQNIIRNYHDEHLTFENFWNCDYKFVNVLFQDVIDDGLLSKSQRKEFISSFLDSTDESEQYSLDKFVQFFIKLEPKDVLEFMDDKEVSKLLWKGLLNNLEEKQYNLADISNWDGYDLLKKLYYHDREFLDNNLTGGELLKEKSIFYLFLSLDLDRSNNFEDVNYELNKAEWIKKLENNTSLFANLEDFTSIPPNLLLFYVLKKHNGDVFDELMKNYTKYPEDYLGGIGSQGLFVDGMNKVIALSFALMISNESLSNDLWPMDIHMVFDDVLKDTKIEKKNIYRKEIFSIGDFIIEQFLTVKEYSKIEFLDEDMINHDFYENTSMSLAFSFFIPFINKNNQNEEQKSLLKLIHFLYSNYSNYIDLDLSPVETKDKTIQKIWDKNIHMIKECSIKDIGYLKQSAQKYQNDRNSNEIDVMLIPMIYSKTYPDIYVGFFENFDIWLEEKMMEMHIPEKVKDKKALKF